MITKDALISDIILRVTQSKPSADFQVEQEQIAFILDQVRWKLMSDKLNKQIQNSYPIDPVYLKTEELLQPVLVPVNAAPIQQKVQITLQGRPLNLYRDRGIVRVFAVPVIPSIPPQNLGIEEPDWGSPLDMVSAADVDTLYAMRFSKPSLKNMKYRREGSSLFILGVDYNSYQMMTFTVTYCPRVSIMDDLDDTDEVPMTEDLYHDVLEVATQKVFDEVYKSGADVTNDGVQNQEPINVNTKSN